MVEMPRPKERLDQYPFELSGGLRQRVIIAMGLVCEPKLLIADEPTTALDVTIQAQILDIIDHLREQLGMAVVLITHDMGVIAGRADRVVVMYAGQKAEEASTPDALPRDAPPLLPGPPRVGAQPRDDLEGRAAAASRDCRRTSRGPSSAVASPRGAPTRRTGAARRTPGSPGRRGPRSSPASTRSRARSAEVGARPSAAASRSRGDRAAPRRGARQGVPDRRRRCSPQGRRDPRRLGDVTFDVHEGETFGLVGESGCGKTTIGRMIVGLETPTAGAVLFDGKDVSTPPPRRRAPSARDRQMMFQDPYSSLDPRMKVSRDPPRAARCPARRHEGASSARASASCSLAVGLDPRSGDRYPHEFSGGQRQRIGLARALALNPRLIVADEPVSALDVSIQAQILNLMKELQREHGLSYVMISHDLAVVYYMADTIGVMYLGKIVEIGDAEIGLPDARRTPTPRVSSTRCRSRTRSSRTRSRARRRSRGELPSRVNPPSGCRFRTRCPCAQDICASEEPALAAFGATHRRPATSRCARRSRSARRRRGRRRTAPAS